MGMSYREFVRMDRQLKSAAAVMTPEAMQAAQQPPMDPAMAGGDPAAMGMPPGAGPTDMGGAPAPAGVAASGPNGGQIPPEILQDQGFIQFLMQVAGIQLDPASGMFIDPSGQPVPAEMIMQAYSEYQSQMMAPQGGAAPMDPSMAGGMPPEAAGQAPASDMPPGGMLPDAAAMGGAPAGAPMDPSMAGADPAAMGGMPPEAASMGGMPPAEAPAIPDEIMNQISSSVMSGIEAVLQDFSQELGKKFQELNDKIDRLANDFGTLADTDDRRNKEDMDEITSLRDEIESDLTPVKQASVQISYGKKAVLPVNIFDLINTRK